PVAPSDSPTLAQRPPPTSALAPERAAQPATVERPPDGPARIDIRAPATVRSGDTFPVTIEVQATRGIRQLAFSVTYKKSILQLVGSSPGAFAQQGGTSAQFEEVSDGSLLVRIDHENGVIAGAGSIAVVEFQALRRGVSPLSVHGVTYVEDGRQDVSNTPTAYEGSITVE
ncbi:MAG: cohesin domain-containing protein, partial [Burkholderiales bacterium]